MLKKSNIFAHLHIFFHQPWKKNKIVSSEKFLSDRFFFPREIHKWVQTTAKFSYFFRFCFTYKTPQVMIYFFQEIQLKKDILFRCIKVQENCRISYTERPESKHDEDDGKMWHLKKALSFAHCFFFDCVCVKALRVCLETQSLNVINAYGCVLYDFLKTFLFPLCCSSNLNLRRSTWESIYLNRELFPPLSASSNFN